MLWLLLMPLQETEDKQMENMSCNSPVLNSLYNTEGGLFAQKI